MSTVLLSAQLAYNNAFLHNSRTGGNDIEAVQQIEDYAKAIYRMERSSPNEEIQ